MALALGWVAFAFVLQKALSYESPVTFYDPYKILGISSVRLLRILHTYNGTPLIGLTWYLNLQGASEREIKKFYKRLSLKL